MLRKRTGSDAIFEAVNTIILTIIGFISLYPFIYVALASFSEPSKFMMKDSSFIWKPLGLSFEGYRYVFRNQSVVSGYQNTLIYLIVGVALNMILTSMAAYVLSAKHYMLKRFFNRLIIFTMYFNAGMIPVYLWINQLNLIDSRWSVILPMAINTYYLIVLRTNFANLPESLIEAAKIDGASDLRILTQIMIPLSKATLAVIFLYYAVDIWNSWLPATMFLRSRDKYPLQVILREILLTSTAQSMVDSASDASNATALAEIIKYATIIVSTVPILIVYPFIQRYFVSGIMIGGVKE